MNTGAIKLENWQSVVIEQIDKHEEIAGEQSLMALSEYDRNRATRIQVSLPRRSGHTTLAAAIACKYPSVLVYFDMGHYKELADAAEDVKENFLPTSELHGEFNPATVSVSVYHIFHDLSMSMKPRGDGGIARLRELISSKGMASRVVVVDRAAFLLEIHPEVIDWLYQVAAGPVVLLG